MSIPKAKSSLSLFVGVITFLGSGGVAFAKDYPAATSAAFRAALVESVPGDTITLTAGAEYLGTFVLPYKAGNGVVTIRSSALSAGVAGVRVSPTDASRMAKLVGNNANPVIRFEPRSHDYRITGVEIKPTSGSYIYDLVSMGLLETSLENLPTNVEIDHCFIHGDPAVGSKRAIAANAININIHDNYISDIKSTYQDTQTINAWNGPGPITITNNYLEASGENIMFGGGYPTISGVIPSDITIHNNHFFKPLAWKGQGWVVKNLLEFKTGKRVKVTGNIFENCWAQAQLGQALNITPRIEKTATWIVVDDITFEYNIVRSAGRILLIAGIDDTEPAPSKQRTSNITFRNNLFYDIAEVGVAIANSPKNLIFDHNTIIQAQNVITFNGFQPSFGASGFQYVNNIVALTAYGIFGSGKGSGTAALNYYMPSWLCARNVFFAPTAPANAKNYPGGNFFELDAAAVGFTTTGASAFQLAPTSSYVGLGFDGKNLGADIAGINAQTATVISGNNGTPTPVYGRPPAGSIGAK